MTTLQQTNLHFKQGSSDKVYHIFLEETPDGFQVNFQYGRRGATLSAGSKTPQPVTREAAEKIFSKLEKEKLAKGYQPTGRTAGTQTIVQKVDTGIYPQLLNDISEAQLEALLADNRYGLQEKKDGRRMLLDYDQGAVRAINRNGQEIPVLTCLDAEMTLLAGRRKTLVDGEAMGETLWAFDLLWDHGEDLTGLPYTERYDHLIRFLNTPQAKHIRRVDLATQPYVKQALLSQIQAANGEGIVFKLLSAPYMAGRPPSGGTQFKFKFWAEADVIVSAGRAGKRSVGLQVYNAQGELVDIGNVTIPTNYPMPAVGEVGRVTYLYYFPSGSLYQPQWRGVRTDKNPAECGVSQLKPKPEREDDEA